MILYVTDHTVNFCVYPPSKPGTQDTLAWFISVVTVTEDTAWGLVPEERENALFCFLFFSADTYQKFGVCIFGFGPLT